jgi:hypothetical protein
MWRILPHSLRPNVTVSNFQQIYYCIFLKTFNYVYIYISLLTGFKLHFYNTIFMNLTKKFNNSCYSRPHNLNFPLLVLTTMKYSLHCTFYITFIIRETLTYLRVCLLHEYHVMYSFRYYPRFHVTAVSLGTYYPWIRGHIRISLFSVSNP